MQNEADEMQTRPEHDREAGHHGNPSDLSKSGAENPATLRHTVFQDESDGMESNTPCCDKNTPEIKAGISFEDIEHPDGQFNGHP